MTREVLKHSLNALAAELDAARAEETFARPRLTYKSLTTDDGADSPDEICVTGTYQWAMVRDSARNQAGERQRLQLEKLAGALSLDAATWTAERETYQDIISMGSRMPTPAPITPDAVDPSVKVERQTSGEKDERDITADMLLSVAAKIYLNTRKAAKDDGSGQVDRYQERLETAAAAFIDVVGDKPLRSYLPIHMQDFATVMGRVPINRSKYRCFDGLSLREIADRNDARKSRIRRLSISSVEGYISDFGSVWSNIAGETEGARDLQKFKIIKPATASPATVREGLRSDSLNEWVRSAAHKSQPHKKWTPIVGLLTGMRLAEIVYLQSKDFTECEGFPVIDLQKNIFIQNKEIVRPLKNEWSDRIVAVHPLLFDIGFVEYAKSQKNFIFPGFHEANDPPDAAQKQMNKWMRDIGIHIRQKAVFHSLRHNAKSWLANAVGDRIADKQCGHAPQSVGARYGFRTLEKAELRKLIEAPPPPDLDFSPFLTD